MSWWNPTTWFSKPKKKSYGIPSFTQKEAKQIGYKNLPSGSAVVSKNTSPSQALMGKGIKTVSGGKLIPYQRPNVYSGGRNSRGRGSGGGSSGGGNFSVINLNQKTKNQQRVNNRRANQQAQQRRQEQIRKQAQQKRQAQVQAQRLAQQRRVQQANQARLNQQRRVAQKQFYNISTPKENNYLKEIYSPRLGTFIRSSEPSGQATGFMRPPTQKQSKKIREANIGGNAVMGAIPVLSQSEFFDYQLTPKQEKNIYGGSTLSSIGKFLNPKYQYKLSKTQEQLRQDEIAYKKINKKAQTYQKDLSTGKISTQQYNAFVNYYNNNPVVKRLSKPRRTAFNIIATSPSRPMQKITTAVIMAGQNLPYLAPEGRLLFGANTAIQGGRAYNSATTPLRKWEDIGQIALGTAVAVSGLKGTLARGGKVGFKGSPRKLKVLKTLRYGGGTALSLGVGASNYYSLLKLTGSKDVAFGGAVGSGGVFLGATFGEPIYGKYKQDIVGLKNAYKAEKEYGLFKRRPSTGGGGMYGKSGSYGSSQQLAYQKAGSEWIYDHVKGRFVRKMTATQATGEFGRLSKGEQLGILKKAFTSHDGIPKIYLDESLLLKDIQLAKSFMRRAGLTNTQINLRINKLFPKFSQTLQQKSTILIKTAKGGIVKPKQNLLTYSNMNPKHVGRVNFWNNDLSNHSQDFYNYQKQRLRTNQKSNQRTNQNQRPKQNQTQRTNQDFATIQRQSQRSLQNQISKQRQRLKQGLGLKQRQKFKQSQRMKTITKQLPKQTFNLKLLDTNVLNYARARTLREGRRNEPRESGGGFGGGLFGFRKNNKRRINYAPTYSVQVKRGGKFRPLGSDYALNKALKIGAKYTRQTLGRTFRIRKTGKTKKVSNINNFGEPNPIIFRNYKIRRGRKINQPFTFIQKTKYSIGTAGEKRAIKEAKRLSKLTEKKKKGKKKKFWRLD